MRRLVPLMFLFACGDNSILPDASSSGDAKPSDARIAVPRAVAVGTDFQGTTGVVSKLEVDGMMLTQNVRAGAASSDPVLRQYGKELFIINRFGYNNVTILNAKTLELVDQISTGADTNPQDVAVVGKKLYVPALGGKGIIVIDRANANAKTEIDLATPLGDADGKPDCVSVYAIGNKVYAACSMQTNFTSVLDSKVAVIDAATDTYVSSATLPYKNPFGFFQRAPEGSTFTGDLLLPLADFSALTTRCVARVSTGATLTTSCAIENSALGGYPSGMSISADGKTLYLAVAESFTVGKLRSYNLETGMLAADALSANTAQIVDVAACPNGDVVGADATTNMSGLRVYRGAMERSTNAMAIGMPPVAGGLVCYDAGD